MVADLPVGLNYQDHANIGRNIFFDYEKLPFKEDKIMSLEKAKSVSSIAQALLLSTGLCCRAVTQIIDVCTLGGNFKRQYISPTAISFYIILPADPDNKRACSNV